MPNENTNTNENTATPEIPKEEVDKVVQDSGEVKAEEKKEVVEQVSDKKKEAEKIEEQSQSLDAENNIEGDLIPKGEKMLAAIGYISFFCILPLVLKPKSKFCQHHGKQGLVLTLLAIIFGWMKIFGTWGNIFWLLLYIVPVIFGIVKSVKGEMWKMPVVNKASSQLDW